MSGLSKKEILILTLRTFFIQMFYNYSNLYGMGFRYCLLPVGNKPFWTKANKKDFLKRHFEFFNTNAYLSGFAVGIAIKMEESGESVKLLQIKNTLSGTLGAVGDNLVNKIILPLMIFSSLNIFILNEFHLNAVSIYFNIFLLLFFNIFNFLIRYYGISSGYSSGIISLNIFKSKKYKTISKLLSFIRDILAAFLIINLFSFIKLPTYDYLSLLNLIFSLILFFYIVKYFPAIYREIALISIICFYLTFYLS